MTTICVRYLVGRAVATHPSSYELAEWPPHPDRLFMALVAAWGESHRSTSAEAALRWLEQQPAPSLHAATEVHRRDVVTVFVPTNDASTPKKVDDKTSDSVVEDGLTVLPEKRGKQPRFFPVVRPLPAPDGTDSTIVAFVWQTDPSLDNRSALADLCRQVTYLGHSSSLVECWLSDNVPDQAENLPRWKPGSTKLAASRLRIPSAGRFDELERLFVQNLRPKPSMWAPYELDAKAEPPDPNYRTVFSADLVILRQTGGRRFGLESTVQLTRALRDTLMALCPEQPAPEWLSGHSQSGQPTERVHVAFMPLANVGHSHGDGRIMGFALALPSDLQTTLLHSILFDGVESRIINLTLGKIGDMQLELAEEARPQTLLPKPWTQPSKRWATVTPMSFDRHPKGKGDAAFDDIESMVIQACEHIGLPRNIIRSVNIMPVSAHQGSPSNRGFPCLQRKSGGNIHHSHVAITFTEAVSGPLMLGAGRYRGYGLFRPLMEAFS
ncbi:MAG: type I-U CRISPR-associated protein Cas5/Cas6 [Opitutaceae bacterium]|nr:type I-U CRISPR-associated protein Cas5/Cas6 [Opitutaceae bacterium]